MSYRKIDLETFPRREHFQYFLTMANPYVGVTVEVDVTDFRKMCVEKGYSFFLSFAYCVGRAANAVPEIRQRILDGMPVEYDRCDTSHTVLLENGTYVYCRLNCMQEFPVFLAEAKALQERAKQEGTLDDGDDALSLLFLSCVPWLHYTVLHQPTPVPADSNPRITWGKFVDVQGRITMPVSILANHALVDGCHLAQFYAALEEEMKRVICLNRMEMK